MSRAEFRALLAVAVTAVVIRLAVSASFKGHSYVAAGPVKPETEASYLKRGEVDLGDSEQYLLLGASIRHRLSYTWNHEPNTFRTPGYPLLLAVLGNNMLAILIVQALLGGVTVLMTGLIGSRLFSPRVGLLGASLLALDIPSIFLSGTVMSEVLLTSLAVLAAALFLGWPQDRGRKACEGKPSRTLSAAAAGMVLGFAALVRPIALFTFVPFGLLLVARRNWRGLVLMLVAFSVLPGIWIVRNYCHYRRFSLTSNGGYNLLYANAAAVIGDEQHTTWDIERLRLARDFTSKLATDNPLELADAMTRKAVNIILHDPFRYAWVCLRGVPRVIAGIKSDDLVRRTLAANEAATQGSVLLNHDSARRGFRDLAVGRVRTADGSRRVPAGVSLT